MAIAPCPGNPAVAKKRREQEYVMEMLNMNTGSEATVVENTAEVAPRSWVKPTFERKLLRDALSGVGSASDIMQWES